jgi:hypothetical protein
MKKHTWQVHVDAYNRSGQNVMAYATESGLVYSQMLYWLRKLEAEPVPGRPKAAHTPEEAFVPVKIKPTNPKSASPLKALGVLEFPNGVKLFIHDVSLLSELSQLCVGQP